MTIKECPNCPGRDDHDAEHCPIKPAWSVDTDGILRNSQGEWVADLAAWDKEKLAVMLQASAAQSATVVPEGWKSIVVYASQLADMVIKGDAPHTAQRTASALLSMLSAATAPGRCEHCDDTGDVHGLDGDWRGSCHCPAGQAPAQGQQVECRECERLRESLSSTSDAWQLSLGMLEDASLERDQVLAELAALKAQQVEFGDPYQGAREDIAIWKRRALEAEEKLRAQCDGQSFMGEPLVQPYEAPREKVEALFKQLGFSGQVSVGEILDTALAALKAQQAEQKRVPDCDRSACGDFSPGDCDHPDCPARRDRTKPAPAQDVADDAAEVMAALSTAEWKLTKMIPDRHMTDEALAARAWLAERQMPPFCGADQVRFWFAPTAVEAIRAGKAALAAREKQSGEVKS